MDKVNMSLDDIIKMKRNDQKKNVKSENGAGNKRANNAGNKRKQTGRPGQKFPVKAGRAVAGRRIAQGAKKVAGRNVAQRKVVGLKTTANKAVVNQATKKLVQKLVKNALRKRTNVAASAVVRKRGGASQSTVALNARRRNNQLSRVLPQARNIVRRPAPARPARQQVQLIQQVARPRPAGRQVVREVITAPAPVRRVIRAPQQTRTVIVQHVAPQQNRRVSQGPRRAVRREYVVEAPRRPIQRVRPQQRVQVQRVRPQARPQARVQVQRGRPQQVERIVERVVQVPQNRFRNQVVRQNDRFNGGRGRRENNRTVVRQVERFQPVQYVTERIVQRRGRGFTY